MISFRRATSMIPMRRFGEVAVFWTLRTVSLLRRSSVLSEDAGEVVVRPRARMASRSPSGNVFRTVEALASLYTLCLEKGQIPASWKKAILVLISKGQLDIRHSKARPICLLNDIGKFFERILDRRLKLFMDTIPRRRRPARVLKTGMQFGFTEGVSTVDALSTVVNYIKNKLDKKMVDIAVSLDIKNAFNSLS